MTIDLNVFSEESIDNAIKAIEDYSKGVEDKTVKLVEEAATNLEEYAAYELSQHVYTGETLASLRKEFSRNSMTARVLVGGAAIWLEFGTGVVTNNSSVGGYVHPKAAELGMYGLGEYGYGHGAEPNYHGIPATMFMYHSAWNVRRDIPDLARRIFHT